jgi:hypothetical protein
MLIETKIIFVVFFIFRLVDSDLARVKGYPHKRHQLTKYIILEVTPR